MPMTASATLPLLSEIVVGQAVLDQVTPNSFNELPRTAAFPMSFVIGEGNLEIIIRCQPVIQATAKTLRPFSFDCAG